MGKLTEDQEGRIYALMLHLANNENLLGQLGWEALKKAETPEAKSLVLHEWGDLLGEALEAAAELPEARAALEAARAETVRVEATNG